MVRPSDPDRLCKATARTTGKQCGNPAIPGGKVCRMHGGKAPQVKRKAEMRLMDMVAPAMGQLWRILEDDETTEQGKLRAIQMVLDRTGYGPSSTVDVKTSTARIEALLDQFEQDDG